MQATLKTKPAVATALDPRWQAVLARDPAADGVFFLGVTSTGIYCRPTCPARRPLPENVIMFDSAAEAQAAGFRACKRCKPDLPRVPEPYTEIITRACREIEQSEIAPDLQSLADAAGMSKYHFHRVFKQVTGLTPRQYAGAQRAKRVREALSEGQSVTDAIYSAGFNATSRFYERSDEMLGMKPTTYRNGGANTTIRFAIGECSLGLILVASSERGLCSIMLGDDPDALALELQTRFPGANLIAGDAEFEQQVASVIDFVEAPRRGLDLPLDVRGTAFQQRVWQALQAIPVGSTASYTEIAQRIGAPKAVRAVAQACAANQLAVAIPCHRVLRSDGGLSGYRWGVERKRALLEREAE